MRLLVAQHSDRRDSDNAYPHDYGRAERDEIHHR